LLDMEYALEDILRERVESNQELNCDENFQDRRRDEHPGF
jgi:hypothetical protein